MNFAEKETYKFICHNHGNFCRVDVLEILPHLPCLTPSDQDRLRASYMRMGNRDTVWELFNALQRRTGWVESLILALRDCELNGLADQVTHVYQSSQPGVTLPRVLGPVQAPEVPAEVPAPWASGATHSIPHNGYQEEPSYLRPVQDTQPPKPPRESSEQAPETPSLGAIPRRLSGPLEVSSHLPVFSPFNPSGHQEQNPELGNPHGAGPISSSTSPRGPVSPTVSFQPLARSTPRASRLPGPAGAAGAGAVAATSVSPSYFSSPSSTSLPSGDADNQARASICPSEVPSEGRPASSITTSSEPFPSTQKPVNTVTSKVPASPEPVGTGPSKVPTSLKPSGANVLTNPTPSKLPVNLTRAGITSSKVPISTVSTKAPATTVPAVGRSSRAKDTLEAPAPTATAGGSSPLLDSSSGHQYSSSELSKPRELTSWQDSQPYSGCSADLAISSSSSLPLSINHGPEENEYMSFRISVAEDSSANLMAGNLELYTVSETQEETEETCSRSSVPWDPWWGAPVAVGLLAMLLVVLYRWRTLQ